MGYISPVKPKRTTANTSPRKVNMLKERRETLLVEELEAQKVISGRVVKSSSYKTRFSLKKSSEKDADACEPRPGDAETDGTKAVTKAEPKVVIEEEPKWNEDEQTFVHDDEEYEVKEIVQQLNADEEETSSLFDETTLIESEESVIVEEFEISGDDKVRNYLSNRSVACKKSLEQPTETAVHDYHEDEMALWRQFEARGKEPILPAYWSQDFRTLPAYLFSHNLEETFINSASGKDYRGIRALLALIDVGPRVRERRQAGLPREDLIEKAFKDYMKWAEIDGGYFKKDFIPIHAVIAAKPGTPVSQMSALLEAQLSFLAHHHRRYLSIPNPNGTTPLYSRPPPLLYGILIAKSKFIVCTYDSALEGDEVNVRTLAAFDFQEVGMDVWNSFAVAIVAITVRNHLMCLAEMGELESADEEESDPDL